jgi:hypothetical protein
MRAIKFNTEKEAIDSWNELEELLKPLHKKGTTKYTYVIGDILLLDPLKEYEEIVSKWLKGKKTFDYEPPKNEELI